MTRCTGLGPMPGTDPFTAADVIGGESAGQVHLPILPARGFGAGAVGRTGALLADLPLDRGARSWRVAASAPAGHRGGRAAMLARDFLAADLDACEEAWGTTPDTVRLPVVGPLSLAAAIELSGGHRLLTDRGAMAYLADSLAEGLRAHIADARRRFGAAIIVHVDEPALAAVTGGLIPDATGGHHLPALGRAEAATLLRAAFAGARDAGATVTLRPGMAPGKPESAVIADAAPDDVWVRVADVRGTERLDSLGFLHSAGLGVALGVVKREPREHNERDAAEAVARLWRELSFEAAELTRDITITPDGGLADGPIDRPAACLRTTRLTAELLERTAGEL